MNPVSLQAVLKKLSLHPFRFSILGLPFKDQRKNGFTMVELSVVVGIIAILTVIAIPQYQSYKARARQKQGMSLLTEYFTAAQNTHAEFNTFPGNFVETGFAPVGTLGYRLQAADLAGTILGWSDPACIGTQNVCTCGGACPTFKTWTEDTLSDGVNNIGPATVTSAGACGAVAALGVTATTFSVRVSGVISPGAGRDQYAIDHNKNLVMCTDGVF